MKYKILLFLIVFALTKTNKAQTSSFEFLSPDSHKVTICDAKQLPDSSYLISGTDDNNNGTYNGFLCHSDKDGNVLFKNGFSGGQPGQSSYIALDNGAIYVWYINIKIFVVKLDSNGNIEWQKYIQNSHIRYSSNVISQIEGSDTMIYIFGNKTYDSGSNYAMSFIKFDYRGNLINSKYCDPPLNNFNYYSGSSTKCFNYSFASVYNMQYGSSYPYTCIVKIDSALNIVWGSSLDLGIGQERISDIIQTEDSGFIFTGYVNSGSNNSNISIYGKLDKNGNLVWEKTFTDTTKFISFKKTLAQDINQYLILGNHISNGGNGLFISNTYILIDSSGKIINCVEHNSSSMNHVLINGNKSVTGNYCEWGNRSQWYDYFVAEVDTSFSGLCSSSSLQFEDSSMSFISSVPYNLASSQYNLYPLSPNFGLSNLNFQGQSICNVQSVGAEKIKSEISIYPNPCNGDFNIRGITNFQNLSLSIYSLEGQLLIEKTISPSLKTEINLCDGIYIVKIAQGEKMYADKIIISK